MINPSVYGNDDAGNDDAMHSLKSCTQLAVVARQDSVDGRRHDVVG